MKLAVVGTGMIVHEALHFLPTCWQVTGICSTLRSVDKAKALCEKHQIPAAYTDLSAMLEEVEADAVYIASPNHLHYEMTVMALEAGKNVILEKPMASNAAEARKLAELAKAKGLFLFEAVSTHHLANYKKTKEWIARIGEIKIVTCNYSQYSSRYNAFKEGNVLPAFDPQKSGGALMDLNHYNINWIVGMFGEPSGVTYHANVQKGIDTSGILTLQYPNFQAVSIAAKDCAAPCNYTVQGDKGYVMMSTPANVCGAVELHLNDGTVETFCESPECRLQPEFVDFAAEIAAGDTEKCYEMLELSLTVAEIETKARASAGIKFTADEVKL